MVPTQKKRSLVIRIHEDCFPFKVCELTLKIHGDTKLIASLLSLATGKWRRWNVSSASGDSTRERENGSETRKIPGFASQPVWVNWWGSRSIEMPSQNNIYSKVERDQEKLSTSTSTSGLYMDSHIHAYTKHTQTKDFTTWICSQNFCNMLNHLFPVLLLGLGKRLKLFPLIIFPSSSFEKLCACMCACVSVCLSIHLSHSICMCVCLSVCDVNCVGKTYLWKSKDNFAEFLLPFCFQESTQVARLNTASSLPLSCFLLPDSHASTVFSVIVWGVGGKPSVCPVS